MVYAYFKFSPTFEKEAMVKVAKQLMKTAWSQIKKHKVQTSKQMAAFQNRVSWRFLPVGEFFSVYYYAA